MGRLAEIILCLPLITMGAYTGLRLQLVRLEDYSR